jgi:multiple sugar transport system ATP-binding protein
MATVTLDRLSKRYPGTPQLAVEDVSLTVEDGEFMVLLGPSGCGKSTTLRMIAGLESISQGELAIDGVRMNETAAKDRDIAMVFQSYALYPHMSVEDNLAFGLKRRGAPKADVARRVREVSTTLGLSELLARRPYQLSGGQRQRVALGRAIVRDPKVFLFDEPLSNLDAALRQSTRLELARLHQRLEATMVYVTHDQVEAMTLGDRICVMEGGRVAQIGKPMEVYRRPATTFVARFLGSPPMNLVEAKVDGDVARIGAATLPLAAFDVRGRDRVTLGIRPEDIHLGAEGERFLSMDARVATVERLGAETIFGVERDGAELFVRVGRDPQVSPGDLVPLAFDPVDLHLFDPETGQAVARRSVQP